jgi:serine/threonine protein kinase
MYTALTELIRDREFADASHILEEGKEYNAAFYIIRKGRVQLTSSESGETEELTIGQYFGEEMMYVDAKKHKNGPKDPTSAVAPYTVTVLEECKCGVLTLENCRRVFDTTMIGRGSHSNRDSIVKKNVQMKDFDKHSILGAGTFGHVWLVSRVTSAGEKVAYALKVQSKYELCESGQAKSVVYEKNIMAQLHHPFLADLVASYQDKIFVYMLMTIVQGGELYGIMHNRKSDVLPESQSRFYLACIAEALAYMHRRGFVYRDLKPENVLIGANGYPIIVDFGFSKYVSNMTYTLCGTPLYLPPEVILNRGHNWAADHWSMGILAYEMCEGETPFFSPRMEQMELFRAIVRCEWLVPNGISKDYASFLKGLIVKQPARRLGSLARGEEDVLEHPFFQSLNFEKLRTMELPSPYKPHIKDPLDVSNFEDWSHLEDKFNRKFPDITAKQEKIFEAF